MPSNQITIKHNKHRIHPCPSEKKLSLLAQLISQNSALKTVVAVTNNIELVKEAINSDSVTVLDDEELAKATELECELLISYDLPSTAATYMLRLAKATDSAIVLLDINEQKHLYPIETLLKRVIKQEIVAGFEYEEQKKMKIAPKPAPKREHTFNANADDKPKYAKKQFDKPKYDKKPFEKPKYDRPKREGENSERKPFEKPKYDKKPNKFLGKDESGKAKFSGKSGDRNHRYDGSKKETTEAPKNVGRKISIKERKPKEDSKPSS
ncbi:hypothetical protein [Sulfurimonas sp.]|uniref:hypothetical protein n=1 Tax=Sulfurimonas sp. TaxID=2022749 RepID=UPI0025DF94E5|nr:hypothetical protein [Sulfurimonas sp.]MBW6488389.1 hypothetical protein [Sulfurimonas sp.]